jgi:hypothetical protein
VRQFGDLSQDELRLLELEEDIRRKDLTECEKVKAMISYVETATSGSIPLVFGTLPNSSCRAIEIFAFEELFLLFRGWHMLFVSKLMKFVQL